MLDLLIQQVASECITCARQCNKPMNEVAGFACSSATTHAHIHVHGATELQALGAGTICLVVFVV